MPKIEDRFDWPRLRLARCRILYVKNNLFAAHPESADSFGRIWYSASNRFVTKLNCTDIYTEAVTSGFPDEFGNYSGTVGIMQRDEAEMCMQSVRTDSLGFDPIRVGAVFGPADMALASPSRNGSKYATNILDVVHAFDNLTYFYIMICLIMVLVILVSILYLKPSSAKTDKRKCRLIGKITMKCLWSVYETVVDQDTFKPSSWSARLIWLFFVIATFVAIVAVLLNFMSTDQIAQVQARRINSLEDLLSTEFAHYQPVVLKALYGYTLFLTANPETKIGQLYSRIKQNISVGVMTTDGSDITDFAKLDSVFHNAISGSNISFVFVQMGYKSILRPVLCSCRPVYITSNYLSKESFGQGILALIFNKHMDSELERYLRYQTMTFNEFDFNRLILTEVAVAIVDKFDWNSGRDTLICNSGHLANDDREENINDVILEPIALQGTSKVCGFIIFIALIVLAVEFIVFSLETRVKRQRLIYLIRQIVAYFRYNLTHRFRCVVAMVLKLMHFLFECFYGMVSACNSTCAKLCRKYGN